MEVHAHTHTAADPDSHRGRNKKMPACRQTGTHYFREFCRFPVSVHWLTVLV